MSQVIVQPITSLDGFIARPGGDFAELEPSAEEHQAANDFIRAANGILFGRVMYELMSAWDTLDLTDPSLSPVMIEFADLFRQKPRVVFSRTLDQVGANATLVKRDVISEVTKLKQQSDGYLALACGPELLAMLARHNLIDEYRILARPVVYGRGKALFGEIHEPLPLRLVGMRLFESGAVMHHYRPI